MMPPGMMVVIEEQRLPFADDSILRYHASLAAKHRRTLRQIYTQPVLAGIWWRDAMSLLGALGATVRSEPDPE